MVHNATQVIQVAVYTAYAQLMQASIWHAMESYFGITSLFFIQLIVFNFTLAEYRTFKWKTVTCGVFILGGILFRSS